ncbi:MAG TPA: hypothetical protein VFG23_26545 [Polyangia bacterium]|nr:hypothetical protein [Polyangia bacterium]
MLLAAVLFAASAQAAPGPAATDGDRVALTVERSRLRDELDRVGAEVDALKKAHGGVGDDYRLRARLADAEALARRLIDIEARLGLRAPAGKPGPLPVAEPTDGPADLGAKADILNDRSRRVRGEADALNRRIVEIKGRQELRRRAADLDRDPFAALEGSKRRVVSVAAPAAGTGLRAPTASTGTTTTPAGTLSPVINPTPTASPTLAVELRDLLDPTTVADIRRLEGTKAPSGSVPALERAVAALRAQADALDAQARAMRAAAVQK